MIDFLRALGRILLVALRWFVAWGLVGAAFGAVMTLVHPDTGHIAPEKVPLMIGVPVAFLGGIAGLLFATLMEVTHTPKILGSRAQIVIGGLVGGAAGIVLANLLAHSTLTVVLGGFLGGLLGSWLARWRSQ